MKKEFTITKEQILKISYESPLIKEKLNIMFPEAFESELEVGKWYKAKKTSRKTMFCVTKSNNINESLGELKCYGFNYKGDWANENSFSLCASYAKEFELATKEEVETALINEAVKRGFKNKVKIKPLNKTEYEAKIDLSFKVEFKDFENEFWMGGYCLMKDGIWAEIIEEKLTIEQRIERLEKLNKL